MDFKVIIRGYYFNFDYKKIRTIFVRIFLKLFKSHYYLTKLISTRLFLARPALVLLEAIGLLSP